MAAGHTGGVGISEALARRARFEDLVTATYVPLQRYLRRRTDPTSADDVLGDVLLVMWRRFDDVPPEAALPWCYAVARGCLANDVRAGKRRRLLHDRLRQERPAAPADPVSTDGLEHAMAQLPDTHREVLRLWAWEQLAPREIAVVLDITANAASIRLHRATGRLRELVAAGKDQPPAGHLSPRQGTEAPR